MPEFLSGVMVTLLAALILSVALDKTITYPTSLSTKIVEAEAYCVGNGGIDQKWIGYKPGSGKHSLKWRCKNGTTGEVRWIENEQ